MVIPCWYAIGCIFTYGCGMAYIGDWFPRRLRKLAHDQQQGCVKIWLCTLATRSSNSILCRGNVLSLDAVRNVKADTLDMSIVYEQVHLQGWSSR